MGSEVRKSIGSSIVNHKSAYAGLIEKARCDLHRAKDVADKSGALMTKCAKGKEVRERLKKFVRIARRRAFEVTNS